MRIYKITNNVNNKIYIGKTSKTLNGRLQAHIKNAIIVKRRSRLYSAIRKYGPKSFSISLVQELLGDEKEKVDEYEKYYISLFNSKSPSVGYNMTDGGDGGKNEASMISSSLLRKGKTFEEIYGSKEKADAVKDKMSKSISAHWKIHDRIISDITKKKMSEADKKRHQNMSQEERDKIIQHMRKIQKMRKNYAHSEKTKKKLSLIQTGKSWKDRMGLEKANELREKGRERFLGANNPLFANIPNSTYVSIFDFLSKNPYAKISLLEEMFGVSAFLIRTILRKNSIDNLQKIRYDMSENELRSLFAVIKDDFAKETKNGTQTGTDSNNKIS